MPDISSCSTYCVPGPLLSSQDIKMNLTPSLPTGEQNYNYNPAQSVSHHPHGLICTLRYSGVRNTGFGAQTSGVETWFLYYPVE